MGKTTSALPVATGLAASRGLWATPRHRVRALVLREPPETREPSRDVSSVQPCLFPSFPAPAPALEALLPGDVGNSSRSYFLSRFAQLPPTPVRASRGLAISMTAVETEDGLSRRRNHSPPALQLANASWRGGARYYVEKIIDARFLAPPQLRSFVLRKKMVS